MGRTTPNAANNGSSATSAAIGSPTAAKRLPVARLLKKRPASSAGSETPRARAGVNAGSTMETAVEATLVRTLTTSEGDDPRVIGVMGTSPLKNVATAPKSCDKVGWVLGVRPKV